MENPKRLYETTFIINASLEDAQIDSAISHASETITRNGGEVLAVNKWGRKRLAYTIQKKNNGYYINLEYLAHGPIIPQLERILLLDENILRFLTIQLDEKAIKARQQAPPPQPAVVATEPPAVAKEPLFEDDAEVSPNPDNK